MAALNINWNWKMPTVGNPSEVAKTNQDYFMQGMDAIGNGIIKGGENRRADEKQKWLEDTTAQKFKHQVEQDRLAQMNANRNYGLQRDIFGLTKKRTEFDIGRQSKQDEWLQKLYSQYFGEDPEEIERLQLIEELKDLPGWQELL